MSDILRLELIKQKNPTFYSDSEWKLANLTYFHGEGWKEMPEMFE